MLKRNENGLYNPSLWVKISLQLLPSGESTTTLRNPAGIALDKNRNVYVAGRSTNNVVVLSPDGSNCREILTQSDGLYRPFSLQVG
jgi:DNA-binding beta-propeller fold protein YncE